MIKVAANENGCFDNDINNAANNGGVVCGGGRAQNFYVPAPPGPARPSFEYAMKQSTSPQNEEAYSSSEEADDEADLAASLRINCNRMDTFFSPDDERFLQNLIEIHNERYKSVNFGEELIKVGGQVMAFETSCLRVNRLLTTNYFCIYNA